jgi:hypothetical protein
MSLRRLVVRTSSRFAVAILSITFASFAHAGTLPIDVVDARPSGGGGGGKGSLVLSGGNIIPGPGDPSGLVNGTISFSRTDACFEFTVSSLSGHITHIGIYHAPAGSNGPEVIVLNPMPPGIMGLRGCVPVDRTLARQVSGDKANYYVMIVTDAYPGGAVRAQLGR